jgi:hypothetical protein
MASPDAIRRALIALLTKGQSKKGFKSRGERLEGDVQVLNKSDQLKVLEDGRITEAEKRTIQEQLAQQGKPIGSKEISRQLQGSDLESLEANDALRLHLSQTRAIPTENPALAAVLARTVKRGERSKSRQKHDPLEQTLEERLNERYEGLYEALGDERNFPGMFEPDEFKEIVDEFDKLENILHGSFDFETGRPVIPKGKQTLQDELTRKQLQLGETAQKYSRPATRIYPNYKNPNKMQQASKDRELAKFGIPKGVND